MIIYLVGILLVYLFYHDYHILAQKALAEKYKRINQTGIVAVCRRYNIRVIVWMTIKIICTLIWTYISQKLNNTVEKIDKNTYVITYAINGKIYRNIVKPKMGPCPIFLVSNEKSEDITDKVLPFFALTYDIQDCPRPGFFGCNTLNFEMTDSTLVTISDTCPESSPQDLSQNIPKTLSERWSELENNSDDNLGVTACIS